MDRLDAVYDLVGPFRLRRVPLGLAWTVRLGTAELHVCHQVLVAADRRGDWTRPLLRAQAGARPNIHFDDAGIQLDEVGIENLWILLCRLCALVGVPEQDLVARLDKPGESPDPPFIGHPFRFGVQPSHQSLGRRRFGHVRLRHSR